jgi:hypothetical protein
MSYAVQAFYQNGGKQAIIGRLFHESEDDNAAAEIPAGDASSENTLTFRAASKGAWGNGLRIRVDHGVSAEVATAQGLSESDLFNLAVRDTGTGVTERFLNVSVKPGPRQVDKVLVKESDLVRISGSLLVGGNPKPRPGASAEPAAGKDPWAENTPATNYKVASQATDGDPLTADDYIGSGKSAAKEGLYLLKKADLFNLLCLPPEGNDPDYPAGLVAAAIALCEEERAVFLVDSPSGWNDKDDAKSELDSLGAMRENQLEEFVPCGALAGVIARTDVQRGVWKAPAGIEATLRNVPELAVKLTDEENGELNPLGINCLRNFPVIGRVVWGSRTMRGADILADEYKYLPVRRLALYIEESLYRGTQWVVFEPNDEPLWAQIRLNVGAFMNNLFRQGAFQGTTPRHAYFVRCDSETTPQNDIDRGIVNIVVGFAPLKPAEFVIIKLQQIAGELEV